MEQVREHEYENYVWCTQLDKKFRPAIFALRAFDVETSLIGDHVKGEMMVLMRCRWWKDAVNEAFRGRAPEQPVLIALSDVMKTVPLTRYRLQRIVSGKEENWLRTELLPDMEAMHKLVDGTTVQLQLLMMEAIEGLLKGKDEGKAHVEWLKDDVDVSTGSQREASIQAAVHVGKGVGISLLLRDMANAAAKQRSYVPLELCQRHGVDLNGLYTGKTSEPLKKVIEEIAFEATSHLAAARKLRGSVPPEVRSVLLPATAADMYLRALRSRDYDVYDPGLYYHQGYSPLRYQLKLKYNSLTGRF